MLELEAFVKANQPRVFYSKRLGLRMCFKKGRVELTWSVLLLYPTITGATYRSSFETIPMLKVKVKIF